MYELDIKDRKILFELDKNSRQSLASLSRKTSMSKQVLNYRINKLVEDGVITRFYTELNHGGLNTQVIKLHIQLENFTRDIEESIFNYFKALDYSTWIVSCSGKWDMICGVAAYNVINYNQILTDILNKFSKYIHQKEIITNVYLNVCNRKWLMPENRSYNITVNGGNPKDYKLSQTDIKILKAIANNSREKLVSIAAKCKLKPNVVKYRLKQLEKMHVINAYRIGINQKLLGKEYCKAFLYMHQKTAEKEKALIDFCKTHPNVTAFIQCIGSWDFEIEFEVDNMDSFHNIMKEIRSRFDFVKSYESVTITRECGINFMPEGLMPSQ